MAYKDDNDILGLVEKFENATIGRDEWKHAEHLIVGLFYIEKFGFDAAVEKMRSGILNLLAVGFKLDLAKEMPYHETITIFWMREIASFNSRHSGLEITETAERMLEAFDKDYPLNFYTRERLFSGEARREYVPPDIKPIHEVTSVNY